MTKNMLMWFTIVLALILILGALYWCTVMPGRSPSVGGQLESSDQLLVRQIKKHVEKLAGEIGERNYQNYDQLEAAAEYIENTIKTHELTTSRETYFIDEQPFHNIIAELPGVNPELPSILIGAHYDSVIGSPGANDNASGVAALLALIGQLRGQPLNRTIRFVAFVNEEPPFYRTAQMGSAVHVKSIQTQNRGIHLMLALETVGAYTDVTGSQRYPFPLSLLYPDRGNFIAFVGNLATRNQTRESVRIFREQILFPAEGIAAPAIIPGIDWSDHWSFWRAGYPALMVTDTALFRYRHYHRATDLPEVINYPRMARVVEGLSEVIQRFANE